MKHTAMIPAKLMLEWEEDLGRFRPAKIEASAVNSAPTIVSFQAVGAADGAYLRLRTAGGTEVDIFLNAAVAAQIADSIRQIGIGAIWLNEDDGSVIVKDPESLAYRGPKS